MIKIGQFNTLTVIKQLAFGVYLEGEEWGNILLPNKYVPAGTQLNDAIDVFIYFDSEDRIIATTQQPLAQLHSCAYLKVIDLSRVGAFLDWGLDKDLLVPKPEQNRPMEQDKSYLVYLKQDPQQRIIASSKLNYCLNKSAAHYTENEEVSLFIAETTPLGRKVVINNSHWGLIYTADIFQPLRFGQAIRGYIKTVREDGKIDVTLRLPGQNSVRQLAERILERLHKNQGFLPLHDKSSPEAIQQAFNDSKKNFKAAIGGLYKQNTIDIEPNGIRLRKEDTQR